MLPDRLPLRWAAWLLGISLGAVATAQTETPEDATDPETLERQLEAKFRVAEHLTFYPTVVEAVKAQNAQNLTLETIRERDEAWINSPGPTPFKRSMQFSDAGRLLRRFVQGNNAYSEAYLTDAQGAVVGVYPLTSDYWQGDEGKWISAFNEGRGARYFSQPNFDDSTGVVTVEVAVPVYDGEEAIGVLILEVSQDYLDSRGDS
ncbi:MAG: hypothetical protein ACFCBW_01095 [Candidatus Competibacterales bacterium]